MTYLERIHTDWQSEAGFVVSNSLAYDADDRFLMPHLFSPGCSCAACCGASDPIFNVSYVDDYTALLSGASMSSEPGEGAFFTYSFPTEVPAYLYDHYTAEELATFEEFTEAYKELAREAIELFASVSGLTAFEAPPGLGDVQFMIFDFSVFSRNSGSAGFAYYPGNSAISSDVFIDNGSTSDSTNLYILLHELGHALGLKHPFDGDVQLEDAYDNRGYTIMSYNSANWEGALGPFDIEAVRYLYGDETADGNQIDSWSWDEATATLTQTGTDSGETIGGVGSHDIIQGLGGNDTIYGRLGDDTLEGGDGDDTLYGDEGDDVLEGGAGNDTLDGGAGNNILRGGTGNDTLRVTIRDAEMSLQADGGEGTDSLYFAFRNPLDGSFSTADMIASGAINGIESFTYDFQFAGTFEFTGSDQRETFYLRLAQVTLHAGGGNDSIFGNGDDTIFAEDGDDYVYLDIEGAMRSFNVDGGDGRDSLQLRFIDAQARTVYSSAVGGAGFENVNLRGNDGDDIFVANSSHGTSFYGGAGDDELVAGEGSGYLAGEEGDDLLVAGTGFSFMYGGDGADRFAFMTLDSSGNGNPNDQLEDFESGVDILELGDFPIDDIRINSFTGGGAYVYVDSGSETMTIYVRTSIEMGDIGRGFYGSSGEDTLTGGDTSDRLLGYDGADILDGGLGDDILDGGSNIDTAIASRHSSRYTITQTSTGVFEVTGPDGTDTLTGIEYLQFANETIRLLPGTGVSVDFETSDPSVYQDAMNAIRDFDGNALGGEGAWLRIGAADVNGDGDIDQILVNDAIGRFATVGTADDGLVYFDDYSWAGETRVAGIYIDPLVTSGDVVAGSDEDSQRRFQNDLAIENINRVLGADDYDGDGLQEVYFALTDGTAYLHAYMHADGNIQYANYQSRDQVIDYLRANGYTRSTWADWFTSTQEDPADKGADSAEEPAAIVRPEIEAVTDFDPWSEFAVLSEPVAIGAFQQVEAFA